MAAVVRKNIYMMKKLMRHGADIHVLSGYGYTSLHLAIEYGFAHGVRILLRLGADAEALTPGGRNALQFAVSKGWSEIAEVIVEHETARTAVRKDRETDWPHEGDNYGLELLFDIG